MENGCTQCPRKCGVDREEKQVGFCGVPDTFRVARAALHKWEEPPISGKNGSGTVFFSGCNLRCVFCQNREISRETYGREVSDEELAKILFRLRDEGAHNINLVTPTHYSLRLARLLEKIKPSLGIPVVWNSGGYERVETLRALAGLVDIYLPDVKYHSPELSRNYAGAPDYFEVAVEALAEMLRQVGSPVFGDDGLLRSGVIVRHLVLPGGRQDSAEILRELAKRFGNRAFLLSLMNQYTPDFAAGCGFPVLCRRVTTFEYDFVLSEADRLGFDGFTQSRSASVKDFTPDFHEKTF